MREKSSTALTNALDLCFAGASPSVSTQPWNQSPFKIRIFGSGTSDISADFEWDAQVGGGTVSHFITFLPQQTDPSPELFSSLRTRLLCYVILSHLPDEALREVCEALGDAYAYYQPTPLRLPSPIVSRNSQLGNTLVRQPISFEED